MELSQREIDLITRVRDGGMVLITPTQCLTLDPLPSFYAPPSAYKLHEQLQAVRPGLHLFLVISENENVQFARLRRGKYVARQTQTMVQQTEA